MLNRILAVALFAVLAMPAVGHAAFDRVFGAENGNFSNNDPVLCAPGGPCTSVVVDIFFDTNSVVVLNASDAGVYGWTGSLASTGTLTFSFSANGTPGLDPPFSTCDNAAGSTACAYTGGDAGGGEGNAGPVLNILMFTVSLAGGGIGDQLLLTGDFTEGNFAIATQVTNVILATIPIPEPNTMVLIGTGLAGLAFIRRKRA